MASKNLGFPKEKPLGGEHASQTILPVSTSLYDNESHARFQDTNWRRSKLFQRILYTLTIACSVYGILHILHAHSAHAPFSSEAQRPGPTGVNNIGPLPPDEHSDVCPQPQALYPSKHRALAEALDELYAEETYRLEAYEALGGAIRIPTESYDDLGPVGEDKRWDVFAKFHEYLEKTYPRVFTTLNVTKVNTYGIVLHWQGSDKSALPVLLAAHQDVVPVEPATASDWVHPPYSGFYDGEWIWGRGSCDDKSDLIAGLQTIDALLERGFEPTRTFVWAYGFDEEASGRQGAGHLGPYLEQTYGRDGIALIIDEGGGAYGAQYGGDVIFAVPSLSEKGYLDIRIEISAQGGHSSVPPKHTAIGLLSSVIVALESEPHAPALVRGGGPYNATQCAATYAPEYPERLRKLAHDAVEDDDALAQLRDALLEEFPRFEAILRTTQAVDLVQGGVKVNALPEKVSAVVNHRIAEHSSVSELKQQFADVVLPVASRYNLSVEAFGTNVSAGVPSAGRIVLSDAFGTGLEPSPVTPQGKGDSYQVLAGTIKSTLESSIGYAASGVVVAPLLQLGNTDTRYYWNLTKNIVRYKHLRDVDRHNGAHTINEAVRAKGWIESIRFMTKLILNSEEHLQ
ncbi:carboxypeptidase S [Trametes polyzona]|nr:carboxypeptidase S [Trametes polyzona]